MGGLPGQAAREREGDSASSEPIAQRLAAPSRNKPHERERSPLDDEQAKERVVFSESAEDRKNQITELTRALLVGSSGLIVEEFLQQGCLLLGCRIQEAAVASRSLSTLLAAFPGKSALSDSSRPIGERLTIRRASSGVTVLLLR